ncbi:Hypothetical predicted protein [Podarcis lilfordi]|uniref:Uncharacterized protein n=1 Tax=Podarcis lilfordi TaxID=74358 RepID=A0AA35K5I1_9SAUR|nr:Hypothetical predicted protein [Podarcis lilfordi]
MSEYGIAAQLSLGLSNGCELKGRDVICMIVQTNKHFIRDANIQGEEEKCHPSEEKSEIRTRPYEDGKSKGGES